MRARDDTSRLTPHEDVNALIHALANHIGRIVGDALTALYLTGSLTYGDFDHGSSDIDYLAVLERQLTPAMRDRLSEAHAAVAASFPEWAERIEGSFALEAMLASIDPPEQPRPYINGGAFRDPDPRYGNEWLINLHAVRERGIALLGPEPQRVIPTVSIADVREASRRDLLEEWVPKLRDQAFFESSHHQAYVTLTLCRILHRACSDEVASKRVAAAWVRERLDQPWIVELIDRAEHWRHGQELDAAPQVKAFIAYVGDRLLAKEAS